MKTFVSWIFPMLGLAILGSLPWIVCPPGGSAKVQRVEADFNAISSSLRAYKMNAGHYPSTEQGLEALVLQPKVEPQPGQRKQIADVVPRDPWNGIYRYRAWPEGDEREFEVISMGRDGQLGTEDDLSSLNQGK